MGYPLSTSSPLAYVGLGRQSAKGTGVAPTLFVPYRSAPTLDHGQAGDPVYEAGTGPYINHMAKTAHDPNGSFACAARPATIAELCAWFLGNDAITGASSPYTHTMDPDESDRVWLTVEQAAGTDGDIIERFVDAVLTSLTFTQEKGNKDLMSALGWAALTPAFQATAATPSYESGQVGSAPGAPLRAEDATYTIDGSAEVNVESFEIALEWKYDTDIRLSSVTRGDFLKLELAGTVKCKQLLNDTDTQNAYRKIAYGSASGTAAASDFFGSGAFKVVYNNGLSSGDERELSIDCKNIDWTMAKYTDLDPAGQTMYVEREGTIKKLSGADFIEIIAKNADNAGYLA